MHHSADSSSPSELTDTHHQLVIDTVIDSEREQCYKPQLRLCCSHLHTALWHHWGLLAIKQMLFCCASREFETVKTRTTCRKSVVFISMQSLSVKVSFCRVFCCIHYLKRGWFRLFCGLRSNICPYVLNILSF